MTRQPRELSLEVCNERHRNMNWAIGIMFSVLTLLVGITGWAAIAANQATIQVTAEKVKTEENRLYIRQDMIDLKTWMKSMADKQDKMNDSLQRLVVQREGDQARKQ